MKIDNTQYSCGGNNFFSNNFLPEENSRGRIYAAIEVPDDAGDLYEEPIYFECIDYKWFHDQNDEDWVNIYDVAPLSVLELRGYPLPPFPEDLKAGDIAWFEFGYSKSANINGNALIYFNLYSAGELVEIEYYESRTKNWITNGPFASGNWLTKNLSNNIEATPNEIVEQITSIDSSGGVAIYDVGQGACQAVLGRDRMPNLYIDFGGGVLGNSKTFPSEYNGFCFSSNPSIVLSHWDWDHWSSAYRFERALNSYWIAPPIPERPIQQAFATHLYNLNRLIIFQDKVKVLRQGTIRIERCDGKTSNDSGLAVTVFQRKGKSRSCLLPGDASYRFIPSISKGERFNSLSMTHHGGRLHSKIVPKPKKGAGLVCSVGFGNMYHHPFLETISAHLNEGWCFPVTTGLAGNRPTHVLIPWVGQPRLFNGVCYGGGLCNSVYA